MMKEQTFNPIIKEEIYQNGFFPIVPIAGPMKAILLYAEGKKYRPLIITNETMVKVSDIRRGKYNRLVEIDLHPHTVRFKEEVMSNDSISKFEITVSVIAQVSNPEIVYEEQIRDVCELVRNSLIEHIEEIASCYSVRNVLELKRELSDSLGGICDLESGIILKNVIINVKTDKKVEELLNNKRDIDLQLELEAKKAEAAANMKILYDDELIAIYSDMAIGKITPTEAVEKSKAHFSENFDERMRQIREITRYIQELEQDDMISKSDSILKVKEMLGRISISGNDIYHIETQQPAATLNEEDRNDLFAEFDEE